MAALPAPHQRVAQHLSDAALAPLLSSAAPNTSQRAALAALSTASIAAFESAQKLGLGLPRRIVVETARDGPLVLHSCLPPAGAADEAHACLVGGGDSGLNGQRLLPDGLDKGKKDQALGGSAIGPKADDVQLAPLLTITVVAPCHDLAGDARRAMVRLERIGVEFQKTWVRERDVAGSGIKDDEETED